MTKPDHETIAILDFGSQYGRLIARRVREHNVFSQILAASTAASDLERLEILRAADEILIDEIKFARLHRKVSQALAVLIPVQTVGVMGDDRTFENVIAVRAVETPDFMTADFCQIPYEVLGLISGRIINEVRGVNRVVYDISSKPPATIEWE